MHVEDLTWVEYQDAIATHVVVLPIGAIDGHGPHLPLSTDTLIAGHMARELQQHVETLVLPTVPYGQQTDSAAAGGTFPGVTNLRAATFTSVVLDLLRASHRHGARRFLILDSHKANANSLREAVDLFVDDAPDARVLAAAWWDLVSEETRDTIALETGVRRRDDHHAATVETSLVMHVAPEAVRNDLVGDDDVPRRARYLVRPVPESLRTRAGTVYRASRASPAIGARVMAEVLENLVRAVFIELM